MVATIAARRSPSEKRRLPLQYHDDHAGPQPEGLRRSRFFGLRDEQAQTVRHFLFGPPNQRWRAGRLPASALRWCWPCSGAVENYFNYFTEIEEHFQRARGTGMFRLSPIDWALLESWKEAGVPLEAVLRGIDRAFEAWHKRKRRGLVNSVAYCAQEVAEAARQQASGTAGNAPARAETAGPFTPEELAAHLERHAATVGARFPEIAASIEDLRAAALSGLPLDWEQIEQRLSVLEDKLVASLTSQAAEEELLASRQQMDRAMAPYRRRMTADQLSMLEKNFMRKAVLDRAGFPRLSLFHW